MNRVAVHHRHQASSPSNQLISHHNHPNPNHLMTTTTTTTTNLNSHPHRVMNKSQHHHTSLSSANVVDNHVFNNSHINQGHHHNNQLRRKCPVHSTHSSGSSHYTSDSDDPETSSFTDDIVEEKIYVTLKSGENLGCSVVRGPQSYPGIFVQDVKRHGVAATSGLEIGDQIVGMNGFSFYPGHYNFDDAISKIKACQQMTLTVRKRVGIHFFPQFSSANKNSNNRSRVASSSPNPQSIVNKQHKIRAIVHSPPSEVTSFHLPLCPVRPVGQNSSSEATDSDYDPEKDFDFALKESSNMNGQSHQRGRSKSNNTRCKVHQSHTSNKVAEMTPDDLRRMQERLDEDRRQLQLDQIRIQEEMRRLVIERKELESLKKERLDDGTTSISTTSSCEGISVSCSSILAGHRHQEDDHHLLHHLHSSGSLSSSCCSTSSTTSSQHKRSMGSPTSSLGEESSTSSVSSSSTSPPFMMMMPNANSDSTPTTMTTTTTSSSSVNSSASNTVTSQMGFLDELKQLAEKRMSHSDGLLMDTLKKTNLPANGTASEALSSSSPDKLDDDQEENHSNTVGVKGSTGKTSALKVVKQLHPDDEKRKQHELLMEEFRSAHLRMFGAKPPSSTSSASSTMNKTSKSPLSESMSTPIAPKNDVPPNSSSLPSKNNSPSFTASTSTVVENKKLSSRNEQADNKVITSLIVSRAASSLQNPVVDKFRVSPSSTANVSNSPVAASITATTVKILKTTKRSPPPPPPLPPTTMTNKKADVSPQRPPLVTITTYKSTNGPSSSSSSTPTPSTVDSQKKVNLPVKINLIRS